MFLATWALLLGGMLLLPRVMHARWAPLVAAQPQFQPGASSPPPIAATSPAAAAAVAAAAGKRLVAWLAWPFAALLLLPGVPSAWGSLVAYM